jgi:hypothetical protein
VNTFGKKILTAALAAAAAATATRNAPVITWDPSTDVGTGVKNYWVLVDGQQRAKPTATTHGCFKIV